MKNGRTYDEGVDHDLIREQVELLHVITRGVLGVGEAIEVRNAWDYIEQTSGSRWVDRKVEAYQPFAPLAR